MLKKFGPYLGLILLAVGLSVVVHNVEALKHAFTTPPEGLYLVIALLFALGYGLNVIDVSVTGNFDTHTTHVV